MNMPGFTAEASLGPTMDHYGSVAVSGGPQGAVLPMQRLGALFREFRCCQFIQGRFRCTSRLVRPWESCRCIRTQFGPFILCDPLVATADF